jgi:Sulfotransferase family
MVEVEEDVEEFHGRTLGQERCESQLCCRSRREQLQMTKGPTIELGDDVRQRLKRTKADIKYLVMGKFSRLLVPDNELGLAQLKCFCCFVGHGRTGSTLVGALLNAHPSIVMSNELNALRRLATGLGAEQLYRVIYLVSRRQARRGSMGGGGYSYEVPSQWQGKHRELTVIGDRKAGATAFEIVRNPELLATLEREVKLEKKFIHVIRNPFDTITTTFQKTRPKHGEDARAHLAREIRNYFARCSAVRMIETRLGAGSICHVFHERLVASPITQLRAICRFLGVDCTEYYLRDCASVVRASPNQSRWSLEWSGDLRQMVIQGAKDWPWLESYRDAL